MEVAPENQTTSLLAAAQRNASPGDLAEMSPAPNDVGFNALLSDLQCSEAAAGAVSTAHSKKAPSGLGKFCSRAEFIRQNSATLLQRTISSTKLSAPFLRKSTLAFFDGSQDTGGIIALFYVTGWNQPRLHFTHSKGSWTTPPGYPMLKAAPEACSEIRKMLPRELRDDERIWKALVTDVEDLEFLINDGDQYWDRSPGGSHYQADRTGCYILFNGDLKFIVPPPEKPALVSSSGVTSSTVTLKWNPPLTGLETVVSYKVYRDDEMVAVIPAQEGALQFEDTDLCGLTKYSYRVTAVNSINREGRSSDIVQVTTADPGRPSGVCNLRISKTSADKIEISWQRPTHLAGAPIESYRIYRDGLPYGVGSLTAPENGWEKWTDSRVEEGHSYIYHVTACRSSSVASAGLVVTSTQGAEEPISLQRSQSIIRARACSRALNEALVGRAISLELLDELLPKVIPDSPSEGQVSPGVVGSATPQVPMPRLKDGKTHIILQAFHWSSCFHSGGWYNHLIERVSEFKDLNISMLWLPPPTSSVAPQGYMPNRWYNLETAYGSKAELRQLLGHLRSSGVVPMLDFVVNHRCGVAQDEKKHWTIFKDPDWESWAIVSNNMVGYHGLGATDTGTQSECAPDIDHSNRRVREDTKKWIQWLVNDIGFGALRLDMAPGYSTKYQIEYVESVGTPFCVGEYWSGDSNVLQNYVGSCRGMIAAFDFALYYKLRRSIEAGSFFELKSHDRVPGLIGHDPARAVTFIDNHDTTHLNYIGRFAGGCRDKVLQGCVYLLTHPGTPCLFWDNVFPYDEHFLNSLKQLCSLRVELGLTAECGVYIDAAGDDLYAAYVSSERHTHEGGGCLAMKLGHRSWCPRNGDHQWRIRAFGNGFCVWSRK